MFRSKMITVISIVLKFIGYSLSMMSMHQHHEDVAKHDPAHSSLHPTKFIKERKKLIKLMFLIRNRKNNILQRLPREIMKLIFYEPVGLFNSHAKNEEINDGKLGFSLDRLETSKGLDRLFPLDVLKKVTELDLSSCRFCIMPSEIKLLIHLKKLSLYGNKFRNLEQDALVGLKNLELLQLNSNKISFIHPDVFRNVAKLKKLYLAFNKLTSLPSGLFVPLKELKILFLHGNKLDCLSNWFQGKVVHLKILKLDQNPLIDKGAFSEDVIREKTGAASNTTIDITEINTNYNYTSPVCAMGHHW